MKNKLFIGIGVIVLIALLVGGYFLINRGNETKENNANNTNNNTEKVEVKNNNDSKVLVAYFSYTGSTEKIALEVANYTNASTFKIERETDPKDLYDDTKEEMESNARPNLKQDIENIDDYDIIFVGYPIWWHSTPKIIDTFLESHDLNGKTIIPFCTSGSSPFSESEESFKTSAKGANVLDGKRLTSTSDVKEFVDSYKLFN